MPDAKSRIENSLLLRHVIVPPLFLLGATLKRALAAAKTAPLSPGTYHPANGLASPRVNGRRHFHRNWWSTPHEFCSPAPTFGAISSAPACPTTDVPLRVYVRRYIAMGIERTRPGEASSSWRCRRITDVTRLAGAPEGLFDALQPLFPDMIAGNYEEWTVYNRSFSTHPWHLHQNHVLITKINGVTLPRPEWHDTLLVPAANAPCSPAPTASPQRRRGGPATALPAAPVQPAGSTDATDTCLGPPNNINLATPGSITFRVYFNPVTVGCFVAHCHVIDHEDLGMMQRLDILPAPGQSSGCTLDVAAATPNLQKLLAMKDSFQICTSTPRFTSWKQRFPLDAEWRAPDLR
jgi:Multicopper oxidase